MNPISVPVIRDTSLPGYLLWDCSVRGNAVIQGWKGANPSGMTGSEYVKLKRAGGAETTVTFASTDSSFALIAAKINTTFPGLAVGDGNGVRLTDPTSVEITETSGFARHGIPLMKRAVADTALDHLTVPVQLDADFADLEHVSKPIPVPPGSNALALDLKLTNPDISLSGVILGFVWESAGFLISATKLIDYPITGAVDGILTGGNDKVDGHLMGRAGFLDLIGDVPSASFTRTFTLPIPPGKAQFRLMLFGPVVQGTQGPPARPPAIQVLAAFGAR